MSKFDYLSRLDVDKTATAEYTIHQVSVNGKSPVFIVAPATEANEAYINAAFKGNKKRMRAIRSGDLSAQMLQDQRKLDRELFPRFVIRGWRHVLDESGNEVLFTHEDCVEYLETMPDWIFVPLQEFCAEPSNFVNVVDIETTAKNLSSD